MSLRGTSTLSKYQQPPIVFRCLKLRNFQNPFDTQNAEARFYPPNRCLGFDFKFKKFSIKQAIFIKDIYTSPVKAHTHKTKFNGFLRFLLLLARFVHLKFLKHFWIIKSTIFVFDTIFFISIVFLLTREKLRNFHV